MGRRLLPLALMVATGCEWLFNPDRLAPDDGGVDGAVTDGGSPRDAGPPPDAGLPADAGSGASDGGGGADAGPPPLCVPNDAGCVPCFPNDGGCFPLCLENTIGAMPIPTTNIQVVARGPAPGFIGQNLGSIAVWNTSHLWLIEVDPGSARIVEDYLLPGAIADLGLTEGHQLAGNGATCPAAIFRTTSPLVTQYVSPSSPCLGSWLVDGGQNLPIVAASWTSGGEVGLVESDGANSWFDVYSETAGFPNQATRSLTSTPFSAAASSNGTVTGWLLGMYTPTGRGATFCSTADICTDFTTGPFPTAEPQAVSFDGDTVLLPFLDGGYVNALAMRDFTTPINAGSFGPNITTGTANLWAPNVVRGVAVQNNAVVFADFMQGSPGIVTAGAVRSAHCGPINRNATYVGALPPNILVVLDSDGLSLLPLEP